MSPVQCVSDNKFSCYLYDIQLLYLKITQRCGQYIYKICALQMTIPSGAPLVSPYTHMKTASSTWCLRTITWILYLATWQQNWRICSTETKFWVSWQLRTAKCDNSNSLILILCLSVCLFQVMNATNISTTIGKQYCSCMGQHCSNRLV
jgi:hypothetical protein